MPHVDRQEASWHFQKSQQPRLQALMILIKNSVLLSSFLRSLQSMGSRATLGSFSDPTEHQQHWSSCPQIPKAKKAVHPLPVFTPLTVMYKMTLIITDV